MKVCMKQVVLGTVMSLSVVFLAAGCSRKTEEIQIAEETATPAPTATPAQTVTLAADPHISVTSTDGNIRIDLPDDTWRSVEEREGEYVFSSPGIGSISITRNTDISDIRLPRSEETVLGYLEDMGSDTSQMEVVQYILTDIGTDGLETVTYTVKDRKEGAHPFITSYIILHTDGLYDATALAEKDDAALLEHLQKSAASLQVLREDHAESRVTPVVITEAPPAQTPVPIQAAETQAAVQDTPEEPARTGGSITLYNVDTNVQTQVYELSDGEWVDDLGMGYHAEGAGQWSDGYGNMYAVDPVMQDDSSGGGSMTLYRTDGSGSVDITQDQEGYWYDGQGMSYYAEGAGQWSDENGDLYTVGQ